MENRVMDGTFWRGRRVFLTGHTGFKGAWMTLVLRYLGAKVSGFGRPSGHCGGVFAVADVQSGIQHIIGDIRDAAALRAAVVTSRPEIVFHLAAQPLVKQSYMAPAETYATNVMGTVNLLEALRDAPEVEAAVIVTSDKCYENLGHGQAHKEGEPLGGSDPYSNSKACAELVIQAYRRSFFGRRAVLRLASARTGNVIGGGDWAQDRLVPDAIRCFIAGTAVPIRNPRSVRPWQHVLDPVLAYLRLAEHLMMPGGDAFAEPWNFGPGPDSEVPVAVIADRLARGWGGNASWRYDGTEHPAENAILKLDCAKAVARLGWRPLLDINRTVALTIEWYRALQMADDMRRLTWRQIDEVVSSASHSIPFEGC
jgi:CDP-glucose 4,6-dehydratase